LLIAQSRVNLIISRINNALSYQPTAMRLQGDQKSGATYLISYIFQHNLYDVLLTKKSVPHYQLFLLFGGKCHKSIGIFKEYDTFWPLSFIHSFIFV